MDDPDLLAGGGRHVDLWVEGNGAVARPAHEAFGQQVCQDAVDRGVRLVENERQLRRVDERRPAEGVEQLSV